MADIHRKKDVLKYRNVTVFCCASEVYTIPPESHCRWFPAEIRNPEGKWLKYAMTRDASGMDGGKTSERGRSNRGNSEMEEFGRRAKKFGGRPSSFGITVRDVRWINPKKQMMLIEQCYVQYQAEKVEECKEEEEEKEEQEEDQNQVS